ncbi:MAG: hypothetical protein J0L63_17185 [Anaerolineae bacterium]|nr:hypothetical protein [Anaerolineae bacterium]
MASGIMPFPTTSARCPDHAVASVVALSTPISLIPAAFHRHATAAAAANPSGKVGTWLSWPLPLITAY